MLFRPMLRLSVLGILLALLLPWALVVDTCGDCLWSSSPDCCLKSGCLCYAHSSAVTVTAWVDLGSALSGAVPEPPVDRFLSSHSRDVFHVPKSFRT
jgi:hypothetical protein